MKTRDIEPFFATLKRANPNPVTELEYTNVFELLAAVLLSAQATDVGVNKATRRLFPRANTPERMLALGLPALTEAIRTIGLYRTKAKNLYETCRMLVEHHGGRVPRSREALEALPGVGRKTANVVLNVAFGEPTMAVDTHIFRVSNRTGLAPGKDVLAVARNLPKVLRERLASEFALHLPQLVRLQGAAGDSTRKFLWRLRDGMLIESVLIPANPALYGESSDRHTLCVSTQVGCAYGCRFCASGLDGWKRNLTADEIVGQVAAVERWHRTQPAAPDSPPASETLEAGMPGAAFGEAAAGMVRISLTVPDAALAEGCARIAALARRLRAD